jgi:hypothetical protein
VEESLGENGEQETTSFSGTSLGTGHQVAATHNNRDGVLLDWRWNLVVGKLDIFDQVVVERRVGEFENGLWNIVPGSLNGNVIVLLEVDTGLLLGWVVCNTEELTLQTGVGRAWDVFTITPLSVTRPTSRDVWSTTGSWVTISILIEGRCCAIPSSTSRRAVATRLEIGSVRVGPAVGTRTSTVKAVTDEDECQ